MTMKLFKEKNTVDSGEINEINETWAKTITYNR